MLIRPFLRSCERLRFEWCKWLNTPIVTTWPFLVVVVVVGKVCVGFCNASCLWKESAVDNFWRNCSWPATRMAWSLAKSSCLAWWTAREKTRRAVQGHKNGKVYLGVSKNRGTPKSSISIGFSIINHPFWGTPICWKHLFFTIWNRFALWNGFFVVRMCFLLITVLIRQVFALETSFFFVLYGTHM